MKIIENTLRLVALVAGVAVALALMGAVSITPAQGAEKVTICHATGSESNPFVQIVVDAHAINGHFDNNGTPNSGHEDDLLLQGEQECVPSTPPVEPPATTTPPTEPPATTTPPTEPPVVTEPPPSSGGSTQTYFPPEVAGVEDTVPTTTPTTTPSIPLNETPYTGYEWNDFVRHELFNLCVASVIALIGTLYLRRKTI